MLTTYGACACCPENRNGNQTLFSCLVCCPAVRCFSKLVERCDRQFWSFSQSAQRSRDDHTRIYFHLSNSSQISIHTVFAHFQLKSSSTQLLKVNLCITFIWRRTIKCFFLSKLVSSSTVLQVISQNIFVSLLRLRLLFSVVTPIVTCRTLDCGKHFMHEIKKKKSQFGFHVGMNMISIAIFLPKAASMADASRDTTFNFD